MKSPLTGKEMAIKRENISVTFRKEDFTICSHFFLCADSGEQFTSTELDELNLFQIHNQYRDKYNLPFPNEIREVRKKYELAATKMSEILGLGINSFRNYENGEVPSNSIGRLIHMVNDPRKFKDIVDLCDTLSDKEKTSLMTRIEVLIQESAANEFSTSMEDYLLGSRLPDSLTGYVRPNFSKLTEMVKFFAERLEPWKTVMNKLLFYSDFLTYRANGYSMSGARYRAIKMGPVPNNYDSIYEFMFNNQHIDIIEIPISQTDFGFRFRKIGEERFNNDIFSQGEIDILELVCSKFATMNTSQIIEFSHNEKAWIENEDERRLINYNYAFDIEQM